jgi:hypothetical protein
MFYLIVCQSSQNTDCIDIVGFVAFKIDNKRFFCNISFVMLVLVFSTFEFPLISSNSYLGDH